MTVAQESIAYGAKVVAGVTPRKGGTRVGEVPVFDTIAQAQAQFRVDASVISVPAPFVKDAAREALAHAIKLIVILTERVPRHDIVAVLEEARERQARIIGPNSLGLIVPGETRVGMCGGSAAATRRAYTRGRVAVLSRSGGIATTEIANLLTMADLGQSTAISLGGDPIIGSTYLDLLPLFEADRETDAARTIRRAWRDDGGATGRTPARASQPLANRGLCRGPLHRAHAGRALWARWQHRRRQSRQSTAENRALREAGVRVAGRLDQIPELVRA